MKNKHIVIVEDDVNLSNALKDIIEMKEGTVDVVHNGDEAVETITRTKADLVVLDMMLPGTTGEFILIELRQQSGFEKTPVLVLTNFSEAGSLKAEAETKEELTYMIKANVGIVEIYTQIENMLA